MRRRAACLLAITLLAASCSSGDGAAEARPNGAESTGSTTTVGTTTSTVTSTTLTPDSSVATESSPEPIDADSIELVDACVEERSAPIGLRAEALSSGGVEYRYQWTLPSTYDGSPMPVVLDFHAIGFTGPVQGQLSGMAELAEQQGFVAVQPTGPPATGDERNTWESAWFDEPDRDDVSFVSDLLDVLASKVCLDRDRVYATGFSSGAVFTSHLVCRLAEELAGAAAVGGVAHDDGCRPERSVPLLAFHGTADAVIPYDGSGQTALDEGAAFGDFFEQVIPDEMDEFATDYGCANPVDTPIGEKVSVRTWPGCPTEMILYTIADGSASWPGSAYSVAIDPDGTSVEIDATAIIWEFFRRHTR